MKLKVPEIIYVQDKSLAYLRIHVSLVRYAQT
jgi:hypothetical protein